MSKGFTNEQIIALGACESPIESKFVQAFFEEMDLQGRLMEYEPDPRSRCSCSFLLPAGSPRFDEADPVDQYILRIQSSVGLHSALRTDFSVTCFAEFGEQTLAVELDGKQFHSSPEQLSRDRVKMRVLASNGVTCIRFSGSEVFADPKKAVEETLSIADALAKLASDREFDLWQKGYSAGHDRASRGAA